MKRMPSIAVLIMCSGCFCAESRREAAESISARAIATQRALEEVARISEATPLPPAVVEPLKRAHKSVSGIKPWTELMSEDFGRAKNAPMVSTMNEISAQTLYKQRIAMRRALIESLPISPSQGGFSFPWTQGATGLFGIVSAIFGVKRAREAGALKKVVQKTLNIIGTSPEAQKVASEDPDVVRAYADKKNTEYRLRAERLEG